MLLNIFTTELRIMQFAGLEKGEGLPNTHNGNFQPSYYNSFQKGHVFKEC